MLASAHPPPHHPPPSGQGCDEEEEDWEEALRLRSMPAIQELDRRVATLLSLEADDLAAQLGRASHQDLTELVLLLLADLRGAQAESHEIRQQMTDQQLHGNGQRRRLTAESLRASTDSPMNGSEEWGRRGAIGQEFASTHNSSRASSTASLRSASTAGGRLVKAAGLVGARTHSTAAETDLRSSVKPSAIPPRPPPPTLEGGRSGPSAAQSKATVRPHLPITDAAASTTTSSTVARNPLVGPPSPTKLVQPESLVESEAHLPLANPFLLPVQAKALDHSTTSGSTVRSAGGHNTTTRTAARSHSRVQDFEDHHRSMSELPEVHEYRHQSGAPAMLPLRFIYFYQDYVSDRFSDGRTLQSTIAQLRSGQMTPATIPPLRVAMRQSDGKYYSLCNRRLACYHYVFKSEPDTLIPVLLRREQAQFMLPQGDGKGNSVRVGGGAMIDGRLLWDIRHCCE